MLLQLIFKIKNNSLKRIFCFCFLFFFCFSLQAEITVSSASSLQLAMSDIIEEYKKKYGKDIIQNSAASGVLANQISTGAKVHIFLSASDQWVFFLQKKNLAEKKHTYPLISNRLVLVQNCAHQKRDLLEASTIAVGDFSYVPAGIYAKNYLQKTRKLASLKEKLIFTSSENQAVLYTQKDLVDMAFVYYSSQKSYKNLCLVKEINEEFDKAITYKMLLIAAFISNEVLLFADFLRTKTAIAIFEKHHFLP
jgi:molybdate transport system substrate-binding protein